jgi:hypothetical protein
MKTGAVQDPGNGAEPHLETDGWTPWLYHAPDDEIERYYSAANALMMKLERMPPAVQGRLKRIEIRCPVKGCLLAALYRIPHRLTAEDFERHRRLSELRDTNGTQGAPWLPDVGTYLYVGRTSGGSQVYDIPFFGFSATPKDKARGCTCCRMVYWRAGCRHGTASLERNWMVDMFSLAERCHHLIETEEQAAAKLPEHLRPLWGKRVFHPEPGAWHPKKRQRPASRPLQMSDRLGGR